MSNIKIGDNAPNFTLNDQDNKPVSLRDYNGLSDVVLFFYPKDFSPGCTKQVCSFRDSYQEFTDLGAVVIGVSSDSVESHKKFLDAYLLPFKLLSDPDGKVRSLYGATKGFGLLPGRFTFIIDKAGVVRYIFSSEINMQKHIDVALRILNEFKNSKHA
jgi:peroxiredoxin Q/BCP